MFGKIMSGVQATYPNEDWGLVGSTVVTGLLVVFMILVFLIFIFWLMGKIMVGLDNRKKRAEEKAAMKAAAEAPAVQEASPVPVAQEEYEDEDDEEIIAVIAAAVAAYSEADGKQYRIASISRKKEKTKRNSWNGAGVVENTRPF